MSDVAVTEADVDSLPQIYRDILDGFWMFNPNSRPEWGIAAETLYSVLHDKWELGELREACEQMVEGGAMRKDADLFYHPTGLGQAMIQIRQKRRDKTPVPKFVWPPK